MFGSAMVASMDVMRIVGARTNNLKNLNLEIPKYQLVVLTGLSGSGKSSLAIETIFAEGQRQYIESLSLYSRQFFEQKSTTQVDSIVGLQPTICINQRRGTPSPRSTIATLTEINDFLRLLYAKVGTCHCPDCRQIVAPQTIEQVADQILRFPDRTKLMILAPLVDGRKGEHREVFETVRKERLVRVRIDGELHDIDRLPELNPNQTHSIEAVTDRIVIKEGIERRLRESLELAAKLSEGTISVSCKAPEAAAWKDLFFNTQSACHQCGASFPPIAPRTFSFNSPYGACLECDGLGRQNSFEIDRVIPDRSRTIAQAVVPWIVEGAGSIRRKLQSLKPAMVLAGLSEGDPVSALSLEQLEILLHQTSKTSPGLWLLLEKELATTTDDDRSDYLESFKGAVDCPKCLGTRLNPIANAVLIDGETIASVSDLTLADFSDWLKDLSFKGDRNTIAEPILKEIQHRTQFLIEVGLGYLALSRSSDSLSGGELQRVRLAKSIGNGLTGVCYVLDEPSAGLHASDIQQLIDTLIELRDRGNSLLVVEHDEAMMESADQIIDIGPEAGDGGGKLVFQGDTDSILAEAGSLTGQYLSKNRIVGDGRQVIACNQKPRIVLKGASGFNLKDVDLEIPVGAFTCVSGVSGSGKSTLVYQTLGPAIKTHFGLATPTAAPFQMIDGLENIDRIVEIDQRPISRSPRGCAATYTGVFDDIRKIFSATKLAKQLGLSASRFSFNSKQGWCVQCEGHGTKRIKMKFMPDVYVKCSACQGKRFNEKTLSVQFAGMNIADVLALSAQQALDAFSGFSRIAAKLAALCSVGLGYLALGQPSTSLSGGEAQRIKLATELATRGTGNSMYLMDEPTTGLHFHDVQMLVQVISELVEGGNTVVLIEHNLDVIACCDWVIDLGPGAGEAGGEIVFAGPPRQLGESPRSITGACLGQR